MPLSPPGRLRLPISLSRSLGHPKRLCCRTINHLPLFLAAGLWQALGIGPFLSRQGRPPPKRPPTCWCPLEARASPAPPVRPNQSPDKGEPACEITPLSCSHWARDTLHPCRSPALPPPVCFTPNVNGSFLEEIKKMGEKAGLGGNGEATACWGCFMGFSGAVRAAVRAEAPDS